MNRMGAGLLGGLAATIVLSGLMLIKTAMGIMPNLNVIKMLSSILNGPLASGWIAHFIIGVLVWGVAFAVLERFLPGHAVVSGILFGLGAWFLMMVVVMPGAGAGYFAAGMGPAAAVVTGVLHIIYGAILGWSFGKLRPPAST